MDMKQNYFKGKSSDSTKFTPYLNLLLKRSYTTILIT